MTAPTAFNTGYTQVSLGNLALAKLGDRASIVSLAENTPEGYAINTWYNLSLAQTFEAFNWGFARARVALVPHTVDPSPSWCFRYQYPTDALVLRYIENPLGRWADAIPYEISLASDTVTSPPDIVYSNSIQSNLDEAVVVYTIDLTDPQFIPMYSATFIQAFTSALAANIAFTITGNMQVARDKQQEFVAIIRSAMAIDANQEIDHKPREAEGIRARQ